MRFRILLSMCIFGAASLSAQINGPESLRDLCSVAGEKGVHISVVYDTPPPLPFENTLKAADLIVRGTVGAPRSQLSNDGRDILTTFELLAPQTLFALRPQSLAKPEPASRMTFTLRGGTVTLGDCTATLAYDGMPVVQRGTDVIFLMRETANGIFAPLHVGMFAVGPQGVRPMLRGHGEHLKFEGRPADQFISEIVAARKALIR
jgi:hypothetical protein